MGGTDGGEGEGLIGREGVVGLIAMSSLSFMASFSLHMPIVVASLLACLRVPAFVPALSCPCCHALIPHPRCHVVVVVPGVSKLGGTSFVMVVVFVVVAAASVRVGIRSCSFRGDCRRLGGRLCLWAVGVVIWAVGGFR